MEFPRRTHHICLVSEQTLPNYLGAIVPDAFPKKVHLVVTSRMKERADILQKALEARGCGVEQYGLAEPRPDAVMEVLDRIYEKTGADVAVNVTGGTKVMALTAVEWASIQDKPPFLFYVDTDSRQILQIGGQMGKCEMATALSVADILYAGAGHKVIKNKNTPLNKEERDGVDALLGLFLKNTEALKLFNACAANAKKSSYRVLLPFNPPKEFLEALDIAKTLEKLDFTADKISYPTENALEWCNGVWLEDYVKKTLYQMKADKLIDDWGSGVEIDYRNPLSHTKKGDSKNELDGVFTCRNRLFLIECKTINLERKPNSSKPENTLEDAIYKLDSLNKTLGGALSRKMLVSVFKPRLQDIQRCEDLNINLLYGSDLLKLEDKLKSWIQNANR